MCGKESGMTADTLLSHLYYNYLNNYCQDLRRLIAQSFCHPASVAWLPHLVAQPVGKTRGEASPPGCSRSVIGFCFDVAPPPRATQASPPNLILYPERIIFASSSTSGDASVQSSYSMVILLKVAE